LSFKKTEHLQPLSRTGPDRSRADIANSGLGSSGQAIPLSSGSLGIGYDLGHAHGDFVAQYDGGKMDGADQVVVACYLRSCPANPQFFYVNPSEVQPYFQMAEQYTFGDRMFQTNEGPSFPAHQFIISGTSAPTSDGNLFFAENPNSPVRGAPYAGCAANPAAFVSIIDPWGKESGRAYPCGDHPTLTDHSWREFDMDSTQRHRTHVRTECPAAERNSVYRFRLGEPRDHL